MEMCDEYFTAALLTLGYVFDAMLICSGIFYVLQWVCQICEYLLYVLLHFLPSQKDLPTNKGTLR